MLELQRVGGQIRDQGKAHPMVSALEHPRRQCRMMCELELQLNRYRITSDLVDHLKVLHSISAWEAHHQVFL